MWQTVEISNSNPIDKETAILLACQRSEIELLPQAAGGGKKWFAVFTCNSATRQHGTTTFTNHQMYAFQGLNSKQAFAYIFSKTGRRPKWVTNITAKPVVTTDVVAI